MEQFYAKTLSKVPKYRGLHVSDSLRLALLYEFGGVYSDSDAIFLNPISKWNNTIGYEGQTRGNEPGKGFQVVNNAVFIFDRYHPFILEFMTRERDEYLNKRKIWAVVIATVYVSIQFNSFSIPF